jgi:hypothetical protein
MLTLIRRAATVGAAACIPLVLSVAAAFADTVINPAPVGGGGGGGSVTCPSGSGSCQITVTTPGTPGTTPSPSQGSGSGSSGSGGGSGATATPSPEYTIVNGECVYAADPTYTPIAGETTHTGEKGAWYLETCPDAIKLGGNPNRPIATTTQQDVWLTNPPPAALIQPTPAQLADRARNNLVLPKPVIGSNPPVGSPQWVGIPTWSFLPASMWTSVSAKAEVPGMSVTATATPVSVTWDYGDGTSATCAGPGTPFASGTDPKASSPDCGHTYRTSSGTAPGGKYQVSATITWQVTWAGTGGNGVLNGLATTATVPVTVLQSQAIITTG